MSQESDVRCTTSIYDIQNRCIPDEIDSFYFKTCIITHNSNVIEQNINVSMFDILSVKEPHKFCLWYKFSNSPISFWNRLNPTFTMAGRRNFFWDHFLKELRHQAQSGNQAFWWFVNNSILTSPDWLKCDGWGQGREHFCYLREKKQMRSYLLTLFFFFNFRVKEYYLISLRSVQIRIFCLWLKYAFFENSKLYSRLNGTEGNFKPRKYLLLNSVLALLSVTFFRRTR